MGRPSINEIGNRYTRLVVVGTAPMKPPSQHVRWSCQCDCGSPPKDVEGRELRRGNVRSCGCLQLEIATTHGLSKHKAYAVYLGAKDRCTIKSHISYKNYGAKGIEFRFESFEQLWSEIGDSYLEGLTLDRRENLGHYEPGNVRWVTRAEQSRNTSRNVWVEFQSEKKVFSDWAKYFGVTFSKLQHAVKTTSVEVAFTKFKGLKNAPIEA